ncbi:hypothetical protein [Francisella persica]|nr:hypothetical protein [Francisella persica]
MIKNQAFDVYAGKFSKNLSYQNYQTTLYHSSVWLNKNKVKYR